MNRAVAVPPEAAVNGPCSVRLGENGVAQAAFRYRASVSTQAGPASDPGESSRGILPRVSRAIAALMSCAACTGSESSGTRDRPA
jgi:hypothetical protein